MAQPQQNISLTAPGFYGLNTQDSPLDMDIKFASEATNCVIDQFGRVASRKGFQQITANPETLNGNPIVSMKEFRDLGGVPYLFCTGNNNIYIQQTSGSFNLVQLGLPAGYVINEDNWQIVPFNDKCYFFQGEHVPLIFDVNATPGGSGFPDLIALDSTNFPDGYPLQFDANSYPNCGTAAFGRVWMGDFDGARSFLTWSALLDGENYQSGDSGALELTLFWPNGADEIVAIHAHNNFLVIYGETSMLLYNVPDGGPLDPRFALVDTIENIGCIARDSVEETGKDVMFLDSTGVRLLSRTIQEKSVPIGDVSVNVRSDIKTDIAGGSVIKNSIKAVYHAEDSFYAVFFPESPNTYVFDTRYPLQNGSLRATTWKNIIPICAERSVERETFFGGENGVFVYNQYFDRYKINSADPEPVTTAISWAYFTHPMDFDSPSNLIFPKQVDATFIGGLLSEVCLFWSYDYNTEELGGELQGMCKLINTDVNPPAYYNSDALYNDAEYGFSSGTAFNDLRYNVWGSGRNIKLGFRVDVLGSKISLQELNIQALAGRIL